MRESHTSSKPCVSHTTMQAAHCARCHRHVIPAASAPHVACVSIRADCRARVTCAQPHAVCMCRCAYTCACMCMCAHVCVCMCMCICAYMCVHACLCTYVCRCICVHVCVYVCADSKQNEASLLAPRAASSSPSCRGRPELTWEISRGSLSPRCRAHTPGVCPGICSLHGMWPHTPTPGGPLVVLR